MVENNSHEPLLHKPVLVQEVLELLDVRPNGVYLDVTFGSGGHTRAILETDPTCRVIAMDWDSVSLDTYSPKFKEEFGDRITFIWSNFANLYKALKKAKIKTVDGILADFGTSQMQIKEREGFSFAIDTPLDMRMSPGYQRRTVAEVLATESEQSLKTIFQTLGEERYARRIAHAIATERKKRKITTTRELAALVERVVPGDPKRKIHPATRIFQALRMYVNKELENIRAFLPAAVRALGPNGRLVCISFHSLEDRMVKNFLKEQEQLGVMEVITKKVVTASEEEVHVNPSSRSAKVRAGRRIGY